MIKIYFTLGSKEISFIWKTKDSCVLLVQSKVYTIRKQFINKNKCKTKYITLISLIIKI